MRKLGLVGLTVIAGLAGCQPAAERRLEPPPLELRATPSSVVEGGSFTLSLTANPGAAPSATGPLDIFVSFVRDAGRHWGYLDPARGWTADKRRHRRIDDVRGAPFSVRFDRVGPVGRYTFRVQFVRPDTAPSRKHYVYQPALVTLRIRPSAPDTGRMVLVLGGLGLLTLGAAALVMVFLRPSSLGPSG